MTETVPQPAPTPDQTPAPTTPSTPAPAPNPTPDAPAFTPAAPDSLAGTPVETFDVSALRLPEGFTIADDTRAALASTLAGLPAERAQALVDMHAAEIQKIAKSALDAQVKSWNDTTTQWRTEIEADPNIGGANLAKTRAAITRLVNEFGDGGSGFREAMNLTGAGNNPHVVRFLHKIASRLYEGGAVQGSPTSGAAPVNIADVFYPSKKG